MILFLMDQVNKNEEIGVIKMSDHEFTLLNDLVHQNLNEEEIDSICNDTNLTPQTVRIAIEIIKNKSARLDYNHPEKAKFNPQAIIATPNKENQRTKGNPNGCTHFSCSFLSKNYPEIDGDKILEIIFQKNLGIQSGVNGDPIDVLRGFNNLQLVDLEGAPANDDTILFGDISQQLTNAFKIIFNPLNQIHGCLITTGIETFSIKVTNDEIQLFDPHGNSAQNEPSCVWIFKNGNDRETSIKNIVKFIMSRGKVIIEETGQLSICPVKIR